jgi:hypothetical protein
MVIEVFGGGSSHGLGDVVACDEKVRAACFFHLRNRKSPKPCPMQHPGLQEVGQTAMQ